MDKKVLPKLTKNQKLKELKKKLTELKEVKLKQALSRYGEAYQDSGASLYENAAWELADEEVSVLRAMIVQIETEIKILEKSPVKILTKSE